MPFIRHGWWCSKCGKSWNAAGLGKLEVGISAYECVPAGDRKWRAMGAAWLKNSTPVLKSDRPWLLVDGAPSGQLGGDGEPLLQGVVFWFGLQRTGATDEFDEVAGVIAPAPRNHPKTDANGNCQDWNAIEIANGDHEADNDDQAEEDEER